MNNKIVKIIPKLSLCISAIIFAVSFCIADIPENKSYFYEYGKIISHSWHDIFNTVTGVLFICMPILAFIASLCLVISKLKLKEKIALRLLSVWLIEIICSIIILYSNVIVSGLWSKNDFDPLCYEFTDGRHKIVIEETSFLLSGGGTIYQIKNGNEAVIIGGISTDDGARNNGNYDIEWYDDFAEITYKTFVSADSKTTEKVWFK